ncbi:hypothetical protein KUTeg_008761 [Tegillarca granosa]|uniref:Uncharacterized protein n=1 Tax=Tegillarca granosa TaxID=220873 RepID=A0ABQ9FD38_TEGGR|nr:hypothetical protein KUTeg_008761 [Tegillarca granosa]
MHIKYCIHKTQCLGKHLSLEKFKHILKEICYIEKDIAYANYEEEEAINVLKTKTFRFENPGVLPNILVPKGLDAARQWYLFEVGPYCPNKEACPKPAMDKPVIKCDVESETDKKRKCSYCKATEL